VKDDEDFGIEGGIDEGGNYKYSWGLSKRGGTG
jgi:hypothetical protein